MNRRDQYFFVGLMWSVVRTLSLAFIASIFAASMLPILPTMRNYCHSVPSDENGYSCNLYMGCMLLSFWSFVTVAFGSFGLFLHVTTSSRFWTTSVQDAYLYLHFILATAVTSLGFAMLYIFTGISFSLTNLHTGVMAVAMILIIVNFNIDLHLPHTLTIAQIIHKYGKRLR